MADGQQALDLGLDPIGASGGPLGITSSQSSHLWDALCRAYQALGFDRVLDGDEVLRDLTLARIIEPTSKVDAIRLLAETGVESASYRTIKRRLPVIAKPEVHQALSAACAAHAGLGLASLLLYDVSTCTSKPMPVTGFASRGSPRSACAVRRLLIEWRGETCTVVLSQQDCEAEGSPLREVQGGGGKRP